MATDQSITTQQPPKKRGLQRSWESGGEVQLVGGVWEMWYHCLGKKLSNNEKKIHHGLKRLQTIEFPHNNQPKTGGHGGGEQGKEAQPLGSVWGPVIAMIWVEIRKMKKNKNIIHLGLRGLQINYFTHNNQPKTGRAVKESRERR